MEFQEIRRAIMMTLGGTLIGALLYIFSISLAHQGIIITHYLIAMTLYICSFLAAFRQSKKANTYIFTYIFILIAIIAFITTYSFITICL